MNNKWMEFKKALPKNWAQLVSESLSTKGLQLSPQQVSQVRCGQIRNLDWQEQVWKEIKELYTINTLRVRKVQNMKLA